MTKRLWLHFTKKWNLNEIWTWLIAKRLLLHFTKNLFKWNMDTYIFHKPQVFVKHKFLIKLVKNLKMKTFNSKRNNQTNLLRNSATIQQTKKINWQVSFYQYWLSRWMCCYEAKVFQVQFPNEVGCFFQINIILRNAKLRLKHSEKRGKEGGKCKEKIEKWKCDVVYIFLDT